MESQDQLWRPPFSLTPFVWCITMSWAFYPQHVSWIHLLFFFFPRPASQVQATQSFAWTIVTASQLPQLILCILSPSCNLYRMQIWPCQLPSEDFQWKLKIKKYKDFQWLPSALSIKTQVLVVANQAPLISSHLSRLTASLPSQAHPSGLRSITTLPYQPHFSPGPTYLIHSLMAPCSPPSTHTSEFVFSLWYTQLC